MEFDWQLNNPGIALKHYFESYSEYMNRKQTTPHLKEELSAEKEELERKIPLLAQRKAELDEFGDFEYGDQDQQLEEATAQAEKKLQELKLEHEEKIQKLNEQRDKRQVENEARLAQRLREISGDGIGVGAPLTEIEQKAIEFEVERRNAHNAFEKEICELQNRQAETTLERQIQLGKLQKQEQEVYNYYEPDISRLSDILNEIDQRYKEPLNQATEKIAQQTAVYTQEVQKLKSQIESIQRNLKTECNQYRSEYRRVERQFNSQIQIAKQNHGSVVELESKKASVLTAINGKITAAETRATQNTTVIKSKLSQVESVHDDKMAKLQSKLKEVTAKKNDERAEPDQQLKDLTNERDQKVSVLKDRCQVAESAYKQEMNSLVQKEKDTVVQKQEFDKDLDSRIVDFVMSGDNCLDEVLLEIEARFASLKDKTDKWTELLNILRLNQVEKCYSGVYEKQKAVLMGCDYPQLEKELNAAKQFNGKMFVLASHFKQAIIGAGVLVLVGLFCFFVVPPLLHVQAVVPGVVLLFSGVLLGTLSFVTNQRSFRRLCRYLALAREYHDFPAIRTCAQNLTQSRELEKMHSIGKQLFDEQYGRQEAQSQYDLTAKDIADDYDRDLKLYDTEYENSRFAVEQQRDDLLREIKDKVSHQLSDFNVAKSAVAQEVSTLSERVAELEKAIPNHTRQLEENERIIQVFQTNYGVISQNLNNINWTPPKDFGFGKLSDNLYVISEHINVGYQYDNETPRPVYCISHFKKPLVVTYDSRQAIYGAKSHAEEIASTIHNILDDLMYAFYRCNSKEIYKQFVVSNTGGMDDFKGSSYKNTFNIVDVFADVNKLKPYLQELADRRDRFASKGMNIDMVNEQNFHTQDRPIPYYIVYFVLEPGKKSSHMEEMVRSLLPGCDSLGFLPIFLCDNEEWNIDRGNNDSVYKEIQDYLSNDVVICNQEGYHTNSAKV